MGEINMKISFKQKEMKRTISVPTSVELEWDKFKLLMDLTDCYLSGRNTDDLEYSDEEFATLERMWGKFFPFRLLK